MSPKAAYPTDSPVSVGDYHPVHPKLYGQNFYVLPPKHVGPTVLYPTGVYVNLSTAVPVTAVPARNNALHGAPAGCARPIPRRAEVTVLTNEGQTTQNIQSQLLSTHTQTGSQPWANNEWLESSDRNSRERNLQDAPRFPDLNTPIHSTKSVAESLQPRSSLTSSNLHAQCHQASINHSQPSNLQPRETTMAHSASSSLAIPGLKKNGLQAMKNQQQQYNLSRRRSRAIAIKRKTNQHDSASDSEEDEKNNGYAAEYEWATWRMYNRIVDHRQKHPVRAHYETSSQTSVDQNTAASLYPRGVGENYPFPVMHAPVPQYNYDPLEGEVFDLEL